VRVADVATVRRDLRDPPVEIARVDGRRTVLVGARMEAGRRVDLWSEQARDTLRGFAGTVGPGVRVEPFFDQSVYTEDRLSSLAGNLLMGAGVVLCVVLVTMGWRQALLVSSALPLTAALVLYLISVGGGALHQMSIFGMIIALGLLIDSAIVVVDEVSDKLSQGMGRMEAVRASVDYLYVPLASSTITTVLAFAPIMLLPGNVGDFVGSIGGSVILAIICSFGVSMTLIAALAGLFARSSGVAAGDSQAGSWLSRGVSMPFVTRAYHASLRLCLARPLLGILVGLALPLAGFVVMPLLGNQFFPPVDRNMFEVQFWLDR
jgi:multidrug efflux pump subunit AcrB